MLTKILDKVSAHDGAIAAAPLPTPATFQTSLTVPATSFATPAGMKDWYPAPMIGAQALGRMICERSAEYVKRALACLDKMEPDDYTRYLQAFYAEGCSRYGDNWGYTDLMTLLIGLSDYIKPRNYLEIGVRRGRSVCAVLSSTPTTNLVLFDMWIINYAGMENPGPELVRREAIKFGHSGTSEFIDGNSHETVPAYFKKNPEATFDLITVDGDHSRLGAAQDIADVLPHLAIGGAIAFDDVCHPTLPDLQAVWQELIVDNPRFSSWTYSDVGYGVGFAIRKA